MTELPPLPPTLERVESRATTSSTSTATTPEFALERYRLHRGILSALHATLTDRDLYTSSSSSSSSSSSYSSVHDYEGNWGRWNFEAGGPLSPHSMAVGEAGVVFSFPGCVDQTIHADCPHLLETPSILGYASPVHDPDHEYPIPLAPHYLNYFIPLQGLVLPNQSNQATTESSSSSSLAMPTSQTCHSKMDLDYDHEVITRDPITGEERVLKGFAKGQTAFVLGSHNLHICRKIMHENNEKELIKRLVRPHLKPGDALIFDCRILHFGLANQLSTEMSVSSITRELIEDRSHWRPSIYINVTREWFSDPKNWNDRRHIF
jgi:hypothetical protein